MFSVLVTESWGASEAIQELYLIERRLDLALTSEAVFQARQRDTGLRLWLKCTDGTAGSSARLALEARLLARLPHRHILGLAADHSSGAEPHLAYPWCAQQPLSTVSAAALPLATRTRLAISLLETVDFLQSQPQPVAHCRLALENLWLTGNAGWLQLTGFSQALEPAPIAALAEDRRAAAVLIWQLLGGEASQSASNLHLGSDWTAAGRTAYGALLQSLRRDFVGCVTADL